MAVTESISSKFNPGVHMEPLLYHLEWDVALEVLFTIIVLSFFAERALSLVFEHRLYVAWFDGWGLKEFIAFAVSYFVVRYCEFDALAILLRREEAETFGYVVTGAIVAGGSKASIKLFHDLMDARSSYSKRVEELKKQGATQMEAVKQASVETGPALRRKPSVAIKDELERQ